MGRSKEVQERVEVDNAILDYASLVQLVMPFVRSYDGTEQGKLDFIAKCNLAGLDATQTKDASWILYDNMSSHARRVEKERQIGKSADEIWGPFDVAWALRMIETEGEG